MSNKHSSDVIVLNVGGQIYSTFRSTLARFSDSIFAKMLEQEGLVFKDEQNNFFFDRDGCMFRYILNFLRTGKLALPNDFKDFQQLFQEADFFGLPQLREEVRKAQQQTSKIYEVVQIRFKPRNDFTCVDSYFIVGIESTLKSIFPDLGNDFGGKISSNSPSDGVAYLGVSLGRDACIQIPRHVPFFYVVNVILMNGFRCISHATFGQTIEVWLFERVKLNY